MSKLKVVLLIPGRLDGFILRDQAEDLLKDDAVISYSPLKLPYRVFAYLPSLLQRVVGRLYLKRLKLPKQLKVVVIFHPLQLPVAEAVTAANPGCELWYGRWDRYELAYDAGPLLRRQLAQLHKRCAELSALTFTAGDRLTQLEASSNRQAVQVDLTAESFPDLPVDGRSTAACFGHHGRRTDWHLLRQLAEQMPQLTLLMIGEVHPEECKDDKDFATCQQLTNFVWLGSRSDQEAARLILCSSVALLPFKREPFNDAGLPYRILKCAKLGIKTVVPPLTGAQTWGSAVVVADSIDQWQAAITSSANQQPSNELKEWANTQSARKVNGPLWERLNQLDIT